MPSLPVVIIWALAVVFGGSLITLAVLYCTRDRGQRASGARVSRRDRQATLDHWRGNLDAARERLEAHSKQPGPSRAPKALCLADAAAYGACVLARGHLGIHKDAMGFTFHQDALPAVTQQSDAEHEAAVGILSQALIGASVRRVYADIEARQVRQLALTAWRTWQG